LLCVCAILPGRSVLEMTCTVLGGMLNPTHLLTCSVSGLGGGNIHSGDNACRSPRHCLCSGRT